MIQSPKQINDSTLALPVNLLEKGMFVCRLDRPWLGTPFLMQGFMLHSGEDIATLQNLCEFVYVDTHKSIYTFKQKKKTTLFKKPLKASTAEIPASIDRDLAKTGLRTVLPVYTESIKSLRACYKQFSIHQEFDAKKLTSQVEHCLDSILQNTSAMSWLSRVKSHQNYGFEHAMHVSILAMVFAVHCGWTRAEAKTAGLAGLLFDIGNIKIPQAILNKPGPLTESEWQLIQSHPKWTRYFLEKSGFEQAVVDAGYYHHERADGNGYPAKRLSSHTNQYAQLIHILDAFDAMTSFRPYAEQRTVFEACRILYRGRGSDFDSYLVDQFIAMMGTYPIGTLVELSSGEVGVVIGQNNNARLLPKLSIIRDQNKNEMPETIVNLRDVVDKQGNPRVRIKTMLHDGCYGVFMHDYTRQLLTS
ncbi:DUF3391 domain-containing protein [Reinekea forsetii]|nr:DUF3391 domain-containing protein [Reinekea forsetii]